MRIAIATVQAPFVEGGAELLSKGLKEALEKVGNQVSIITMPFMDTPIELIEEHVVASRLLDISNSWAGKTDLCIGLKFPAYCMPHPNKVMWILHQHRAAYDLYNTEFSNIKDNAEGNRIRQIIKRTDSKCLNEAKRIYTISRNDSLRMKKFNKIDSIPLYHPCPCMEEFFANKYDNYVLMPSRINITKRQMLALEAMKYVKSDLKLYIVGKAENEFEQNRIEEYIDKNNLKNKVKLFGYVGQKEKIELYANARVVLFIPIDEDYGYITLEAMASSKPVITAIDSGGPLEFVLDGKTGSIVDPDAQSIARAIDFYGENEKRAIDYGKTSKDHLDEMNISWDNVVRELTRE